MVLLTGDVYAAPSPVLHQPTNDGEEGQNPKQGERRKNLEGRAMVLGPRRGFSRGEGGRRTWGRHGPGRPGGPNGWQDGGHTAG